MKKAKRSNEKEQTSSDLPTHQLYTCSQICGSYSNTYSNTILNTCMTAETMKAELFVRGIVVSQGLQCFLMLSHPLSKRQV